MLIFANFSYPKNQNMRNLQSALCCTKYLLNPRCFLIRFSILCFIISLCSCEKDIKSDDTAVATIGNSVRGNSSKPNILFIVGDDIGYEIPTCNGGQSYSTPNLDEMAAAGTRFTECHALPLCSPSRISLLTGKTSFRNYTTFGHLNTDQRTIGNMFSDAGYATCYAGKWQLDGGDASAHIFGWQKYSVFLPFLLPNESLEGSRYKSPKVYQDGGYLPASSTADKYSEDIFTAYLLNFIDSMQTQGKPFFAYYAMILAHGPFCPTPDDPQYATWDYTNEKSDKRFFPSMIKYMDKKIGEIITHLREKGLLDNTVIIYIGDNGTPPGIVSTYNGFPVKGGKAQTTEIGINVPLIIECNNKIPSVKVSNTLIGLPDFMPTLADIAGIPKPLSFGTLDGVSFYSSVLKNDTLINQNIFSSYCVDPNANPWRRWVQDDTYKLFDTNVNNKTYKFVKVTKCMPDSIMPLKTLTQQQKKIRRNFINVLRSYN
jgi:arylsulfatase A